MSDVPWVGGPAPSTFVYEKSLYVPAPATAMEKGLRRPGRTVTVFRDEFIEAVIGTKYSSLHPDREWIVVDLRLRALGAASVEIGREDFSLTMGNGSVLKLPDREEIAAELSNIGRTMIAASAVEDSLDTYLPPGLVVDRIPFVTRIMLESIVLEAGRVAAGKLLFRARRGTRIPALYELGVSNRNIDVRIPFRLPTYDFSESRAVVAIR